MEALVTDVGPKFIIGDTNGYQPENITNDSQDQTEPEIITLNSQDPPEIFIEDSKDSDCIILTNGERADIFDRDFYLADSDIDFFL